ncbi:MAG: hypothetical protein Q9168_007235, partial [Polycauliona sp. 1 TL-2023]
MANTTIELPPLHSPSHIRALTLQRLATANLTAIEAYLTHNPTDNCARAIESYSTSILSLIAHGLHENWPQNAFPAVQIPAVL